MNQAVKYYKIADPIVQSAIYLTAVFDFSYRFIFQAYLPGIILWQTSSLLLHLLIRGRYKLRRERTLYSIALVVAAVTFLITNRNMHIPTPAELSAPDLDKIPTYFVVFLAGQSLLSLWYLLICVREIGHVVKRKLG